MELILESDIIEAYLNENIDEYDIIELYSEGYISENTMDLLLSEDDYISEAFDNVLYEMEALEENEYYDELEEGRFTRGLNHIRAALTFDKAKKNKLYTANVADAFKERNRKAAKKYADKARVLRYGLEGKAHRGNAYKKDKEIDNLKSKWKEARKIAATKHADLKDTQDKLKQMTKKSDTISDFYTNTRKERDMYKEKYNDLEKQHNELQKKHADAVQNEKEIKRLKNKTRRGGKAVAKIIAAKNGSLAAKDVAKRVYKKNYEELEKQHNELQKKHNILEKERQERQNRFDEMGL